VKTPRERPPAERVFFPAAMGCLVHGHGVQACGGGYAAAIPPIVATLTLEVVR
jgi:hypothetical protein